MSTNERRYLDNLEKAKYHGVETTFSRLQIRCNTLFIISDHSGTTIKYKNRRMAIYFETILLNLPVITQRMMGPFIKSIVEHLNYSFYELGNFSKGDICIKGFSLLFTVWSFKITYTGIKSFSFSFRLHVSFM